MAFVHKKTGAIRDTICDTVVGLASRGPAAVRIELAFWMLAHIVLIRLAYSEVLSPILEYQGFYYYPISPLLSVLTAAFALAPCMWLPLKFQRPSQIVYYFIYVCIYVPGCTIPVVAHNITVPNIFMLNTALLICLYGLGSIYRRPLLSIPKPNISHDTYFTLLCAMAYGGCALLAAHFGATFNLHSFDSVYDIRLDLRDTFADGQKIFGYLWVWEANVVLPALFVYAWRKNRWLILASAVVLELYIYSFSAMKGVVFYIPLVFGIVFLLSRIKRAMAWAMIAGPPLISALFMFVDYVNQSELLTILLVRRQFIVPGWMLGAWFEFFADKPKVWLTHSIFRHLGTYPYDLAPGQLVGADMLNSSDMNACANFWADGFANFGIPGLFIATGVVAICLYVYDSLTSKIDIVYACAAIIIPGLALADSGILTNILTHGLGLALLLGIVMPTQFEKLRPLAKLRTLPVRQFRAAS